MKKLLISSALLAMCAGALAGSLSVAVVDKEGKPVPDAIVLVFPSDKSAMPKTPLPAQAGFELRLEGKSAGKPSRPAEVTLSSAGALNATLLGCFIHGSMRGYVYASETPWAAKTTAEGLAVFDDLPEGAAQVKVWQADQLIDLAPQAHTVTAAPGNLRVQLNVTPRRRRI